MHTYQTGYCIQHFSVNVFQARVFGLIWQVSNSYPLSLRSLHHLVRGFKQSQGSSLTRPLRQQIRIAHLTQMLLYLRRSSLCAHNRSLIWSVVTFGFSCLLGCSEVSDFSDHQIYGPNILLVLDVNLSTDVGGILLHIRASNTDPLLVQAAKFTSVLLMIIYVLSTRVFNVSSLPCWTVIYF